MPEIKDATRTETESVVQAIWRDVLDGRPVVDVEDTFLYLGGDSIAGMLCVNRVRAAFGVAPPVSLLLDERTTLRCFSAAVDAARR